MKTNMLTGADLNRAVAMALGHQIMTHSSCGSVWHTLYIGGDTSSIPNYAGDIALAWPVIKKHGISLSKSGYGWLAALDGPANREFNGNDTDPQIAAMRCLVASVYGVDVEMEQAHPVQVPDEGAKTMKTAQTLSARIEELEAAIKDVIDGSLIKDLGRSGNRRRDGMSQGGTAPLYAGDWEQKLRGVLEQRP